MSRRLYSWIMLTSFAVSATGCGSAGSITAADTKTDKGTAATTEKEKLPARITSSVDVNPATKRMTAAESREVSFAAGRILKHVAQARSALTAKKVDDAKDHVDQGLKLVEIINSVVPHFTVKTEIKAGGLVYKDDDDVAPQYVTVFDELEHRDVITPVSSAKMEVAEKAKAGQKTDSNTGVQNAALVVSQADIDYSALRLNIHLADRMLKVAKKELADGKAEPANLALLTLQASGVILEYDEIELPLEEAADNLKIAEADLKAGNHEAARTALLLAMDELKAYEKMTGPSRSKEVKAMHDEMAKLSATLIADEISPEERKKIGDSLSNWWDKLSGWFRKK